MSEEYLFEQQEYKSYKSGTWFALRSFMISFGSLYIGIAISYFLILTSLFCPSQKIKSSQPYLYYFQNSIPALAAIFGASFISKLLYKRASRSNILVIGALIGIAGTVTIIVQTVLQIKTNSQNPFFRQQNCKVIGMIPIYLGRFLEGLAVGVFSVNCPLFIYELSPLEIKIILGGFFQLSIEVGIIITRIIQTISDSDKFLTTYLLLGAAILPLPFLIVFSVIFLKQQTPKYWISIGQFSQAKSLITSVYKEQCSREIYLDKQAQQNFQEQIAQHSFYQQNNMSVIKRKCLILGIYAAVLQQMSGINFFNIYGPLVNQNQDDTPIVWKNLRKYKLLISSICQFLGTFLLFLLNSNLVKIKKCSERRFLLKWGTILIFIVHVLIACTSISSLANFPSNTQKYIYEIIMFVLLLLFMIIFGFTLGPIFWLYVPQIMDASQLQKGVACNWALAFFNIYLMVILCYFEKNDDNTLGYLVGTIFFITILCIFLFFNQNSKSMIIQTKNKTHMEINQIVSQVQINKCLIFCCKKQQ